MANEPKADPRTDKLHPPPADKAEGAEGKSPDEEAKSWTPAKGNKCRFRHMTNGPRLEVVTAKILRVRDRGRVCDLEVTIAGNTHVREAVPRAESPDQAPAWLAPGD